MAKYYCILFDADNTLLNFDAAESKALAETLVNYGIEPDAETVQTYRTINEELWRQLEKGQIKREKLMAERFTRFLKAIDAAGDGAEMNRFYLEEKKNGLVPRVAPELTPSTYWRYKNAHYIDQKWSLRAAGIRQRHIDQAQSINLYITNNYTLRQVLELYVLAWEWDAELIRRDETQIDELFK